MASSIKQIKFISGYTISDAGVMLRFQIAEKDWPSGLTYGSSTATASSSVSAASSSVFHGAALGNSFGGGLSTNIPEDTFLYGLGDAMYNPHVLNAVEPPVDFRRVATHNISNDSNTGITATDACPYCGYTTKTKANLITHIRRHTGEKRFQCSYCSKRFVAKSELNMHLKIHTKEKLFNCRLCDYRTPQKPKLKVHIRKHHPNHIYSV